MKKALIAYTSHSGSTREIAQFMQDQLTGQNLQVDVKPIAEAPDLTPYDLLICGGLLYRFGWHPQIVSFVKRNQEILKNKKVALFVTGLRLVKTPVCDQLPCPVTFDPSMLCSPKKPQKLSPLEKFSSIETYLGQVLPDIAAIKPLNLAFFSGKLDFKTLGLPEKMIMALLTLLTGKQAGDYRNWDVIKTWINGLKLA